VIVRLGNGVLSLMTPRIGDVLELDDEAREEAPEHLRRELREMLDGVYKLKDHLLLGLNAERLADLKSLETDAGGTL
jgi:purine-binding chemotaxis protein CheW